MLPVTADENRRIEVFERELWRIAVEHLDYGEQVQWAALAGARVAPAGWRRARAMLHFDQGGELKRTFLITAVDRNKNAQLRLRALQEIAASRDAEAFDRALDFVESWPRDDKREGVKVVLQALAEKKIGRRDQANNWIWRCANMTREVHEEYAVQRWPETKRLLGLLVNSSGGAHARNARRLVHAARQQDRRLRAALLAAAIPHTAEAGEVVNGARTRMSRKPAALARELLRNFPKGKGRRGTRRRKKKGAAEGVAPEAVLVDADGVAARGRSRLRGREVLAAEAAVEADAAGRGGGRRGRRRAAPERGARAEAAPHAPQGVAAEADVAAARGGGGRRGRGDGAARARRATTPKPARRRRPRRTPTARRRAKPARPAPDARRPPRETPAAEAASAEAEPAVDAASRRRRPRRRSPSAERARRRRPRRRATEPPARRGQAAPRRRRATKAATRTPGGRRGRQRRARRSRADDAGDGGGADGRASGQAPTRRRRTTKAAADERRGRRAGEARAARAGRPRRPPSRRRWSPRRSRSTRDAGGSQADAATRSCRRTPDEPVAEEAEQTARRRHHALPRQAGAGPHRRSRLTARTACRVASAGMRWRRGGSEADVIDVRGGGGGAAAAVPRCRSAAGSASSA